jgi:hypothetical protein
VHENDITAIMARVGNFRECCSILNTRVHDDVKDGPPAPGALAGLLEAKAAELKRLGELFLRDFIALNDAKNAAFYLKALNKEAVSMSKRVGLVGVSGSCIEALNQKRKKAAATRGGGKGMVRCEHEDENERVTVTGEGSASFVACQLATRDAQAEFANSQTPAQVTAHRRMKQERAGTHLEAKRLDSQC